MFDIRKNKLVHSPYIVANEDRGAGMQQATVRWVYNASAVRTHSRPFEHWAVRVLGRPRMQPKGDASVIEFDHTTHLSPKYLETTL